MLEFLTSPTFRRILAAITMVAVPILNKKFGWGLDATDIIATEGALIAYLTQSAVVQMHATGSEAQVAIANAKTAIVNGVVTAGAQSPSLP